MTPKSTAEQVKIAVLAVFVITLCLQASCSSTAEGETPAGRPTPAQIAEARAAAERLFAERTDLAKLREAVRTLSEVRDPESRDFETEWTYAKYNFFLGKAAPEKEKEAIWERGKTAGQIAARLEPNRPEGHFWYGANLGELAKFSPVTVGIKSVDDIQSAMNRVIELDPGYQSASAFDALAQVELATRMFGDGSAEKAVEYLEKGIELGPENALLRATLAEAYVSLRRSADARKQIDAVLAMQPNPSYIPEHDEAVEKAKKLLTRIN